MKNRILFDADGTLYSGFSIFPLFHAFTEEGVVKKDDNERLQDLFVQYDKKRIDYRTLVVTTLTRAAASLKDQEQFVANRISEEFFSDPDSFSWFGYVEPALKAIGKTDARVGLITAEPQFIARGIANALGFYDYHSSQLGINSDGTYRGDVIMALNRTKKGDIARRLVNGSASAAFGDTEGDIGMFREVDKAICIQPTDELREEANRRHWTIIDNPDQPLVDLSFIPT